MTTSIGENAVLHRLLSGSLCSITTGAGSGPTRSVAERRDLVRGWRTET